MHPLQAVRTGLPPVRTGVRTELPEELHLPGREFEITASPALCVIGRSHRAGDATYSNELPRRHRLSRLEQSARHKPSQLIEGATVLARASAKGASRERRRD